MKSIHMLKRFSSSSSTTFIAPRPTPSKVHHHSRLPDSSFPKGYLITGLHCGIKKPPKTGEEPPHDLALLLSTSVHPTSAAGCFTHNAFKAAPVLVSQEVLQKNGGRARAVVVNSGGANAVTGKKGLEDAWTMVKETDVLLSSMSNHIHTGGNENSSINTLVMSTGVIGNPLPISKIVSGIRSQKPPPSLPGRKEDSDLKSRCTLGTGFDAWERAAKAFMTTDTFPKLRSRVFRINDVEYRMGGIDKGAGMIHPYMVPLASSTSSPSSQLHATLLGCILTDAAVSPRSLQSALAYAVERSFNSISVDGEMSTNDTILVLANGAANGSLQGQVKEIDEEHDVHAYEAFRDELTSFAVDLAKLVVRDGEGATKFVKITVEGAPTYADAQKIASRISTSALVKTALYGEDAKCWGRVLSAAGSVSLSRDSLQRTEIDPSQVSVSFVPSDGSSPLPVLVNGEPENVDEERAKKILGEEEFGITVDMGIGSASATYWTCDFSYEYVKINGDYRS